MVPTANTSRGNQSYRSQGERASGGGTVIHIRSMPGPVERSHMWKTHGFLIVARRRCSQASQKDLGKELCPWIPQISDAIGMSDGTLYVSGSTGSWLEEGSDQGCPVVPYNWRWQLSAQYGRPKSRSSRQVTAATRTRSYLACEVSVRRFRFSPRRLISRVPLLLNSCNGRHHA